MCLSGKMHDYITFLQVYRSYPCLWNKNDPDFKNRLKREEAEVNLLPLSGLPNVTELKKKIRNIRCTYNQETTKIRNSFKNGTDEIYKPKLYWFELADSFLRINNENPMNESTEEKYSLWSTLQSPDREEYPDKSDEYSMPEIKPVIMMNTSHLEYGQEETCYHQDPPDCKAVTDNRRKRPKTTENKPFSRQSNCISGETYGDSRSALQNPAANGETQDEFRLFGDHIVCQLKHMPLEDALTLQVEVQALITKHRIESIRKRHSTRETQT